MALRQATRRCCRCRCGCPRAARASQLSSLFIYHNGYDAGVQIGVTTAGGPASARSAAVGVCEDPGHIPRCVAVGDVVAAVVELLAAAQADLQLSDAPTGDVPHEGDEGLPLGLS